MDLLFFAEQFPIHQRHPPTTRREKVASTPGLVIVRKLHRFQIALIVAINLCFLCTVEPANEYRAMVTIHTFGYMEAVYRLTFMEPLSPTNSLTLPTSHTTAWLSLSP